MGRKEKVKRKEQKIGRKKELKREDNIGKGRNSGMMKRKEKKTQ